MDADEEGETMDVNCEESFLIYSSIPQSSYILTFLSQVLTPPPSS